MAGQSSARQIGRTGTGPTHEPQVGWPKACRRVLRSGTWTNSGALFEGDPLPLPVPTPRGTARYTLSVGRPADVKHAEGYERFVALIESRAGDPATLASDISQLVEFIQRNAREIAADAALTAAAAAFSAMPLPDCKRMRGGTRSGTAPCWSATA